MKIRIDNLEAFRRRLPAIADRDLENIAFEICERLAGNDPATDAQAPATRQKLMAIRHLIGHEQDRRLIIKRLKNAGPRIVATRGVYKARYKEQ